MTWSSGCAQDSEDRPAWALGALALLALLALAVGADPSEGWLTLLTCLVLALLGLGRERLSSVLLSVLLVVRGAEWMLVDERPLSAEMVLPAAPLLLSAMVLFWSAAMIRVAPPSQVPRSLASE